MNAIEDRAFWDALTYMEKTASIPEAKMLAAALRRRGKHGAADRVMAGGDKVRRGVHKVLTYEPPQPAALKGKELIPGYRGAADVMSQDPIVAGWYASLLPSPTTYAIARQGVAGKALGDSSLGESPVVTAVKQRFSKPEPAPREPTLGRDMLIAAQRFASNRS